MTAKLIDGKAIAARLRSKVAGEVARVNAAHGLTPGIAVVMAGDDPASNVYVRAKSKAVAEAGMLAFDHRLPADAPEAALLDIIARLNVDDRVHGILVQQPLPKQMDPHDVVEALNPAKDVDGFHPFNAGRLARGLSALVPCTPQACVWLAKSVYPSLAGMEAVVIGRSNIVGKPLVHLLLAEDTTVTIAHSKTRDLPAVCRRADLLVAAVGRPEMIRAEWIKPGAMVIDVGINRVPSEDGKSRIVGDVEAKAREVAGALTPVPGGVGPMTIACLLLNTLRAACAQWKLPQPSL